MVALKLVAAPSAERFKLNEDVRLPEASPSAPALTLTPNKPAKPPETPDVARASTPADSSEASVVVELSPEALRSAPTVSSKRRLPNEDAAPVLVVTSTDGASSTIVIVKVVSAIGDLSSETPIVNILVSSTPATSVVLLVNVK